MTKKNTKKNRQEEIVKLIQRDKYFDQGALVIDLEKLGFGKINFNLQFPVILMN